MTAPLPPGPKINWVDSIVRQFTGRPQAIQTLADVREMVRPFNGVAYYRAAVFDIYIVWSPEFVHGSIVEQPFSKGIRQTTIQASLIRFRQSISEPVNFPLDCAFLRIE